MLKRLRKYINILTLLSLVFFVGGIYMILNGETSCGMTMGRYGNHGIGTINGYVPIFVGLICLYSGIVIAGGDKEK